MKKPVKSDPILASYEAAIRAMEEFDRAFGALPMKRRDPELNRILQVWRDARPAVMQRLQRVKQRKEG